MENHYVLALPEVIPPIVVAQYPMIASLVESQGLAATPFLERAISYLPTTTRQPTVILCLHLEATEQEHKIPDHDPSATTTTTIETPVVHIDIIVDRKVPLIGCIILLTGFFSLASFGAAWNLQQGGVTPTRKTVWRQMATSLYLLPMVMKSLYYDGFHNFDIVLLPVAAVTHTFRTTSFVTALQMTSLANAFVLSNRIVSDFAGRFVLVLPVLPAEGMGALTGFPGAAVCADDAARSLTTGITDATNQRGQYYAMLGNRMALSCSFATAGYLIIAKKLRPKMDLFVIMFCIMSLGCFAIVITMAAKRTYYL
jgi:hypothetical protein